MTITERVDKILKEIEGVVSLYGVTKWEEGFLANIRSRTWLTTPQETTLIAIEHKVFESEAND